MKLIGTGSALPKKKVTNAMLSEFLDTSDEWIIPRTGIRSRHVISDENLEDLGAEAASKALEMAGLKPEDIDYFICSNVVNEYMTPGLSCIISEKIGLTCPCIDINCACPGFIYAMDIAECRFEAGKAENVLIVCAEEPTRMTDWKDRATCVLSATVPELPSSPKETISRASDCIPSLLLTRFGKSGFSNRHHMSPRKKPAHLCR